MISKTKIGKRIKNKKDEYIVETILLAKKNKGWLKIAQILSAGSRSYSSINLKEIDEKTKEGDTIIVPGKVLGSGELSKKVRICSLGFSESAKEKIKHKKGEIVTILEEIRKNPKAEGVKIIR